MQNDNINNELLINNILNKCSQRFIVINLSAREFDHT